MKKIDREQFTIGNDDDPLADLAEYMAEFDIKRVKLTGDCLEVELR